MVHAFPVGDSRRDEIRAIAREVEALTREKDSTVLVIGDIQEKCLELAREKRSLEADNARLTARLLEKEGVETFATYQKSLAENEKTENARLREAANSAIAALIDAQGSTGDFMDDMARAVSILRSALAGRSGEEKGDG